MVHRAEGKVRPTGRRAGVVEGDSESSRGRCARRTIAHRADDAEGKAREMVRRADNAEVDELANG